MLRPGGRVCVADLVVDDDLPPEVLSSGAAWAGCIAGALSERVFVRKLERAGLVDIDMGERASLTLDDVALYPLFTPDVLSLMRRLVSNDAQQHIATSLIARARKPASHTRGSPAAGAVASTVVRKLDDLSGVGGRRRRHGPAAEAGGGRRAHRQGRRAGSRHTRCTPTRTPTKASSLRAPASCNWPGNGYRSHQATCSRSPPTSPTPSAAKAPLRCGWCAWTASSTDHTDGGPEIYCIGARRQCRCGPSRPCECNRHPARSTSC